MHAYGPGHSPKAASIHEGHSGIQAEKGIAIMHLHLAVSYSGCSVAFKFIVGGKSVLVGIFLPVKGFGLEFMHISFCPIHWPELACGPTKR